MLVYIRESDKDKIICDVDEKDIAEHLRVSICLLLKFLVSYIACVFGFTNTNAHITPDALEERAGREGGQKKI